MVVTALEEVEGVGRLLIDLEAALSGDSNYDLEVEDGDTLMIPVRSNTVAVVGEVRRSGTHTFQRGLLLEDYIELSAGLTQRADAKGVYIIKANGSVLRLQQDLWRLREITRPLSQAILSWCL